MPGPGQAASPRTGSPSKVTVDMPGETERVETDRIVHSQIGRRLVALGFDTATVARFGDVLSWDDVANRVGAVFSFVPEQALERGAIRFVGGAGAGKTALLIKVLAQRMIDGRTDRAHPRSASFRPTTQKMAGNEALATACELLRVRFDAVSGDRAVSDALAGAGAADLTLIDTAGNARVSVLSGVSDIVVLPAIWQDAVLRNRLLDAAALAPLGVALTHVDTAPAIGVALSAIAAREVPLAWISIGPDLPGAFDVATPGRLFEMIARGIDRSEISTTFTGYQHGL